MTFSRTPADRPGPRSQVSLEQVDHGQIRRGLPVGDRAGLHDEPAVGPMGVGDLPHQPRLAHAGLPDQGHELAMSRGGAAERLAELLDLGLPPDEAREPARGGGLEPRAQRARPQHLVDLDGRLQALDRHRPSGLDGDEAFGEAQRVRGQEGGAGAGELLHAGREVRGLAHRRVVHAEVAADGPHDDLPRVQPDANLTSGFRGCAEPPRRTVGSPPACRARRSRRAPRGPRGRAAPRTGP